MTRYHNYLKNIVLVYSIAMFFSCTNSTKEVRDFLADKNYPIGVAKNGYHVYKDSGRITSKLQTPVMFDFSNRKEHPYNEFPKGVKIINFEKNGDSVTITGKYAISYNKTAVSKIKGDVVVINHASKTVLHTDQLFWDKNTHYFFSEKSFKFIRKIEQDTIRGVGFECKEDLSKWESKNIYGPIEIKDEEL